ncbi:hypothetical protein SASPL_128143 [Salvia splendens]|uniref:Pectate lyase n=1 Tax=Salvia splendens TaxID=180675 RepID=A0A8X8XAR6_SALSN|nr:hypothetical protein SASPL_128143 [Salvia splendens]
MRARIGLQEQEEAQGHHHKQTPGHGKSISKRGQILETPLSKAESQCLTGNPIDDCWHCGPNWGNNRQRLADCAIGFGQGAMGGKGGRFYVATDSSDHDTVSPTPGTLRYAVIQEEPLWIVFKSNMVIKLKHELIFNSYKTIDGRGANVQITGNGCQQRHHPQRARVLLNIWIDHCTLSHCTDGLVDITMGSTAVTVSNNYLSDHDKVMLLGHDDKFLPDSGMQVTIAFNRFGKGLVQRLPRVRRGYYIHVVNNDYYKWEMYAIGGSANPTVNSEGNRFTASDDHNVKELEVGWGLDVTKHEGEWANWNWRSDGDLMLNGAFFVPSGDGAKPQYAKASSFDPISVNQIDQLTMNAGVLDGTRDTGVSYGGGSITFTGAAQRESPRPSNLFLSSLIILILLYISSTIAGGFL